jgi:hypothetical protein
MAPRRQLFEGAVIVALAGTDDPLEALESGGVEDRVPTPDDGFLRYDTCCAMTVILGEGGPMDKASIALATSKNRPIPNKRMPELAPQTALAAKKLHAKGSWQLRSRRSTYNCVGLVFANRRTFIEPEEIPMILQDDEYVEVTRDADVMPGDIVIYKNSATDDIIHIGLVLATEGVFETRKIRVLSQFGRIGEYIHDAHDVPEPYGHPLLKFYSESRKAI